jgi:hypothetical protein
MILDRIPQSSIFSIFSNKVAGKPEAQGKKSPNKKFLEKQLIKDKNEIGNESQSDSDFEIKKPKLKSNDKIKPDNFNLNNEVKEQNKTDPLKRGFLGNKENKIKENLDDTRNPGKNNHYQNQNKDKANNINIEKYSNDGQQQSLNQSQNELIKPTKKLNNGYVFKDIKKNEPKKGKEQGRRTSYLYLKNSKFKNI